jgi:ribosomal protein S18 acetylase RimI-like enzyme
VGSGRSRPVLRGLSGVIPRSARIPGWAQERWIEWISDDEDFRPEWTLLATIDGNDVGFIVGEATGWIVQMGVVPTARGKDIGARLIAEAVQRMRSAGETTITLNVNVDNPHATALYSRSASPVPVTAPVTRFKPDPHSPYALTHSGLIGV